MSRLAFWLVQSATVLAIAAPDALANHIAGATYNGTEAQGGTAVTLTVSSDGAGVSSFSVAGPVQGNFCSFSNFSTTYGVPLPITNHTFSDTTAPFYLSGGFPGVQSASGTFRISSGGCSTGDIS